MTTQLRTLRTRLSSLKRRRAIVRYGSAWCMFALVVILALLSLFVLDWSLRLPHSLRLGGLVIVLGLTIWAFRRFILRAIHGKESLEEMALLVEQEQQIDSDLVAALQFESPAAANWGAPALTSAVVDYVADFSPNLNVFQGFQSRPLWKRLGWLLLIGGVVLGGVLFFPGHASAFFQRLGFQSVHYPTSTVIDVVYINGQIGYNSFGEAPVVRSPAGEPVIFHVQASGKVAQKNWKIRLRGLKKNAAVIELDLEPIAVSPRGTQWYTAKYPKLVESVQWQAFVGDGWTEPQLLEASPLPVVAVRLTAHAPEYLSSSVTTEPNRAESKWQLSVFEGSDVDIAVRCVNKPLRSVKLVVGEDEYPLTPPDATEETEAPSYADRLIARMLEPFQDDEQKFAEWTLPTAGTPFRNIRQPIPYEIHVVDQDGQQPAKPLQGYIGLKTDEPARVAAALMFRRYLPKARPRIEFGAADDHGLSKLTLNIQIVRQSAGEGEPQPLNEFEQEISVLDEQGRMQKIVRGSFPLQLAPYELKKNDQLKITLHAADYRGEMNWLDVGLFHDLFLQMVETGRRPDLLQPPVTTSEPLVIEITDRIGLGAELNDAHRTSARQMNVIIQQQLGIGDAR